MIERLEANADVVGIHFPLTDAKEPGPVAGPLAVLVSEEGALLSETGRGINPFRVAASQLSCCRRNGTHPLGIKEPAAIPPNLPARIHQHRTGAGSDFCRRYGLDRLVWAEHTPSIADAIVHGKRVKRWRREWKFALIERGNPDWLDLYDQLI